MTQLYCTILSYPCRDTFFNSIPPPQPLSHSIPYLATPQEEESFLGNIERPEGRVREDLEVIVNVTDLGCSWPVGLAVRLSMSNNATHYTHRLLWYEP
jgi:hypothetical protein